MIRIFVDDKACIADVSQRVKISYHSTDLSNVESGREGTHILLKIPSTPENDRLFGNAAEIDTAEIFNEKYHAARIEADNVEIFRGTAYLAGVEIEDGATWYLLEIIGGASLWAKQSAQGMFNELGVEYSARLDMLDICNSWQSDSPVKFLPVHRDREELHNGQTTIYTHEKILTTDDYHPFLSVAALVRAIFENAGYEVESRFMDSDLFRSLYMSGAYSTTDITAKMEQMEFKAGRLTPVTTTANYAGRVYVTPSAAANSLGNIVDVVAETVVDELGIETPTGFYSRGGCFALADDGRILFKPLTTVKASFQYHLKFACDYRIANRYELECFDYIYLDDGVTIPFTPANRFKDHRQDLQPDFEYRIVIFDYASEYDYRLRFKADGKWSNWIMISERTRLVQSPSGVVMEDAYLERSASGAGIYEPCTEDWALYGGYVAVEGSTEIELSLRTPAVEITPTSPKYFDSIYFGGGWMGQSLTLLPGTTLQPIFTSAIGYGSQLEFADVAQIRIRQNKLLDAVRQMFNLRFYTDEWEKRVFVEPYDDFIRREELFDWSDRIDLSQPILIEEQARHIHERRTLGYLDEDGTVRRYNTAEDDAFGDWSFEVESRASIEGEEQLRNPIFSPTINLAGKYANAESALVMQVADRDDETTDNANFSPRIVRYIGLSPLANGERWGFPYGGDDYPLAAFHFAGNENESGFTLCFEDRDGVTGLHSYYDRQFAGEAQCRRVTLTLNLSAEDFAHLFHFVEGAASIRSTFALMVNGVDARYELYAIEEYNPATGSARCVFTQIALHDA